MLRHQEGPAVRRHAEVERGGDVTLHAPGQLVGYPILDLSGFRQDLHWYLRQLEETLISGLSQIGVGGDHGEPHRLADRRAGDRHQHQRAVSSRRTAERRRVGPQLALAARRQSHAIPLFKVNNIILL